MCWRSYAMSLWALSFAVSSRMLLFLFTTMKRKAKANRTRDLNLDPFTCLNHCCKKLNYFGSVCLSWRAKTVDVGVIILFPVSNVKIGFYTDMLKKLVSKSLNRKHSTERQRELDSPAFLSTETKWKLLIMMKRSIQLRLESMRAFYKPRRKKVYSERTNKKTSELNQLLINQPYFLAKQYKNVFPDE